MHKSKNIFDLPLHIKFLAGFCGLIMLPLIISFLVIYKINNMEISEKEDEKIYLIFQQRAQEVNHVLRDMDAACIDIITGNQIEYMAKTYAAGGGLPYERLRKKTRINIEDKIKPNTYFSRVSFSMGDQMFFQYGVDIVQYEQALDQEPAEGTCMFTYSICKEELYKNARIPLIMLVRAIAPGSEKGSVLIRYSIRESYLYDVYRDQIYKGAQSYIVDSRNRIVSGGDKEEIGTAYQWSAGEGHTRMILDGVEHLILAYPIENTDWKLLYTIPLLELSPQYQLTATYTIATILICLIFGILFYGIFHKSVLMPVNRLKEEMIQLGQVSETEDQEHIRDEMILLSRTFEHMTNHINDLIEKVYKAQIREKEAQLQALISQINPHFLYNTLDSIRWNAVLNQDHQVAEQIEVLSKLFRHVLNNGNEMTTIRDEIAYIEDYIYIQQLRFGDKIHYHITCEECLKDKIIINLILQPLIENSIQHGHEKNINQGNIWVRIYQQQDELIIEIEDDGLGADAERIRSLLADEQNISDCQGLKNTQERIRIKYGSRYGLRFESHIGKGTLITVSIPIKMKGG